MAKPLTKGGTWMPMTAHDKATSLLINHSNILESMIKGFRVLYAFVRQTLTPRLLES